MSGPAEVFGEPLLPGELVLWAGQPGFGTQLWETTQQELAIAASTLSASLTLAVCTGLAGLPGLVAAFAFSACCLILALPLVGTMRRQACLRRRRYAVSTERVFIDNGRRVWVAPQRADYPYEIAGEGRSARVLLDSVTWLDTGPGNCTRTTLHATSAGVLRLAFEGLDDVQAPQDALRAALARREADV